MWRKMSANMMDRKITINRVDTVNVKGIAKRNQVVIASNIAAYYRPLMSKETYQQEQTTAIAEFEFVVRWTTAIRGVLPKDAIKFAGSEDPTPKIYEVIAMPEELGRREYLSIKARLQDANSHN